MLPFYFIFLFPLFYFRTPNPNPDILLRPHNINSDLQTPVHPTPLRDLIPSPRSSDLTLPPIMSSLSYFLYEHCFTLPYLSFPVFPSVMPIYFCLTHIRYSQTSVQFPQTWIVLCSLFVQTSSYISSTTPVCFLSLNLDLSST